MNRRALAGWLVGHTRHLLTPLTISVLARIVGQVLGISVLVVAADSLVAAALGRPVDLLALTGLLVGLSVAKAVLRYLEHYAGHWVAFSALEHLRRVFFERLHPQAPAATTGAAGAELTSRATADIDRIEVFFAHTFPPVVAAVVVPALSLTWLGTAVDVTLAWALAPVVALSLGMPFLAAGGTWRRASVVATQRGRLATHLGDDLQGAKVILGFGRQTERLAGLARIDADLTAARSRAGAAQGVRAGITTALQGVSLLLVLLIGGAEPASIAIGLAVAVGLWGPTKSVDDFAASLDAAFAATARIHRVIEAPPLVSDPLEQVVPEGAQAVWEAVNFSYPGTDLRVLHDVDVTAPAGSWTCVVGASGSGKSTLGRLLVRGWDPDSGVIRLGGVPLVSIGLEELRSRVGYVPQRPMLMSGTIAGNLRLGAPEATTARLEQALDEVGLGEWVASLPDGLDAAVSERGVSVSGGQLQRLALARALVADPSVLVLDEALSQLDAATARAVRDSLAARADLTVIEVTHRVDLIPDEVLTVVLDAGRVVETGSAGELRAAARAFVRLEARVA